MCIYLWSIDRSVLAEPVAVRTVVDVNLPGRVVELVVTNSTVEVVIMWGLEVIYVVDVVEDAVNWRGGVVAEETFGYWRGTMRTNNDTARVMMKKSAAIRESKTRSTQTQRRTRGRRSIASVRGSGLNLCTQPPGADLSDCLSCDSSSSPFTSSAFMSVIYAYNSPSHNATGKKQTESNKQTFPYPPPRGDLLPLLTHLCFVLQSADAKTRHTKKL